MKSFIAKHPDENRDWIVMDAAGKPVGRLAVAVACALRGRDKPTYTPHVDTGAFVVVINASQVKLTGKKEQQKVYQHYTGFRSGLKTVKAADMRQKHPDRIVKEAVKGMLPGNQLARGMYRRLKVYAGAEHPHAAQQPRTVDVKVK